MLTNRLLTSIQAGRPAVGFAHNIQDPIVTETFRDVQVDFLLIDMQHVPITIERLENTLIALQPTELSVLVRPLLNDPAAIGQVLDAGATGVIVPMVNTEDDAQRAVAAAKYPPDGIRSWGSRRGGRLAGGADIYARDANDNAMVIVQIETVEALDNLDAILAVSGLSGVMIGPADLAISLGYLHDRENPAVQKAIQRVLDRCLAQGVPFGFFTASADTAKYWIERGALIVNCSSDTAFVAEGVARLAAELGPFRKTPAPTAAERL